MYTYNIDIHVFWALLDVIGAQEPEEGFCQAMRTEKWKLPSV